MCLLKAILSWARVMVFNATFNNMSVISWWSVLLVEEYTEKTSDLSQVTDTFYHIMLYRVHLAMTEVLTHKVLIAQVVVNSTTMQSQSQRPPKRNKKTVISNEFNFDQT